MRKFMFLIAFLAAAGIAYAQPTGTNYTEQGATKTVIDGTLEINGSLDSSGMTATTTLAANPLVQGTTLEATTANVNAGTVTLLVATTGKTIYPTGPVMIQASGTAASATSITIKCSGGRVISTFPIALLVDDVPVGSLTSSNGSFVTNGAGLVEGCPSGEAVQISKDGSDLTTTTSLFVTLPYIVQ